jgi:hypothetical protein
VEFGCLADNNGHLLLTQAATIRIAQFDPLVAGVEAQTSCFHLVSKAAIYMDRRILAVALKSFTYPKFAVL